MAQQPQAPITQRAYTLRLSRAPGECAACHNDACDCWQAAIWATHEAVNNGAKAFGDWLLTLRGGLCHTLADMEVPAKGETPARKPTDEERRDRRVLLALSWLSVEDERRAPQENGLRVATGRDTGNQRGEAVKAALRKILQNRGVKEKEIGVWLSDCGPSLEARIREDAVWINRSAYFDKAVERVGNTLTREVVWDFLEPFFGTREAYFAGLRNSSEEEGESTRDEEEAKDLVQKAGQWLSSRFGTGKGADFSGMAAAYDKMKTWAEAAKPFKTGSDALKSLSNALSLADADADAILKQISGPGYKSASRKLVKQWGEAGGSITAEDLEKFAKTANANAEESRKKAGGKGHRPYSDAILKQVESACGFTYLQDNGPARHFEFAVMLDHAARRVSIEHSWIKRAEQRRREFEEDAKKLDSLKQRAPRAVEWLDQFCTERSATTGSSADGGYRIRKRAVEGWAHVAKAWARPSCKTEEDRIAVAREVQVEPEIDKFGDIRLFEALAADDAACVWRTGDDNPDLSVLTDYMAATTAQHNQTRFKVPAYRHPDPLRHPVFCDFGKSRWSIRFAVHDAVKANKGKRAKKDTRWLQNRHGLRMGLWNGGSVNDVDLHWSSKRLTTDLALDDDLGTKASEVTRADRLGRAASGSVAHAAVLNVFEEKVWNGRLQAPRAQLDRIAKLEDADKHRQAETLRRRLRWLVSFSPRLRPSGPFIKWAASLGIAPNRKGEYYPNAPTNKGREGLAKLALSRLPGLRVLSVDLGHRFAAGCAVWEALPSGTFKKEIRGLNVLAGGPSKGELCLQVEKTGSDGKPRTVIYRRIGPDQLPDGTVHPAPWARLDRQFLIKLQGEDEGAREASNEEIWAVHQLEVKLGRTAPLVERIVRGCFGQHEKQKRRLEALRRLGWEPATSDVPPGTAVGEEGEARKVSRSVDDLMFAAVRTMRLALRRHGDRARIAFAMTADHKPMPGGRKYYFDKAEDASTSDDEATRRRKHIEFFQDALLLWHDLFSSRDWKDGPAKALWDQHIANVPGYQAPEGIAEDLTGSERKKKRKKNRDKLRATAEALAKDSNRRRELQERWKQRWEADNGAPAEVDQTTGRKLKEGSGWHARLRWFQDWVMPSSRQGLKSIRHVGGLSLTRLAMLTEFRRKVQVGFFTRLHPDGTKTETKEEFGQSTLDTLEHLREQRVKQLASRIIEAALGIGRIKISKGGKTPRRPRRAVDASCHAVVIESLTHYRPDDLRSRWENRQLMQWSSAKVQKYLEEGCQLYGLHLREVPAKYTSLQCSRTGLPGVRCDDVPVGEFLTAPWWNKTISAARKKLEKNGTDSRNSFFVELLDRLKQLQTEGKPLPQTVRVPRPGGDLFVAAPPGNLLRSSEHADLGTRMRRAVQADLNAAANIGLRALLDPDWPGRWWYVPCKAGTSEPAAARIKGSAAFRNLQSLPAGGGTAAESGTGKGRPKKDAGKPPKEIEYFWRDPSADGLATGQWSPTLAYWNAVQSRVVRLLRRRAGLDS